MGSLYILQLYSKRSRLIHSFHIQQIFINRTIFYSMTDFWLFLIEAIPLAILIGIAAACIGYTAWGIMVPLLFVGFGFGIFDAILISLMIDLVNSIILTGKYSKQDKVNFKEGTKWGLLALSGAIIAAFFAISILPSNEAFLRGSVGYVFFLLSAFFIYRGYNLSKTQEKNELTKKKKLSLRLSSKTKTIVMGAGVLVSGILSGLLGIGSGANYALLFLLVLGAEGGFDILRATGTSCYIMAMVSAPLCLIFSVAGLVNFELILPYLAVGIIFSAIGTVFGSSIALKVSESKLNYLVGIAIFITALVSSIQAIMLPYFSVILSFLISYVKNLKM